MHTPSNISASNSLEIFAKSSLKTKFLDQMWKKVDVAHLIFLLQLQFYKNQKEKEIPYSNKKLFSKSLLHILQPYITRSLDCCFICTLASCFEIRDKKRLTRGKKRLNLVLKMDRRLL